jgi:hypothetical protein
MPLPARLLAACALVAALATGAQAEAAKKPEKDKDAAKPALVGTYGDWSVYQSAAGKTRICYTLATPKDRAPTDLKRDPGYAFISERPGERVRNEVSFIMGFEIASAPAPDPKDKGKDKKKADPKDKKDKKETSDFIAPTAAIGDAEFELLPKGNDLWVKNAAQESRLIDEMRKGTKLLIKAASKRGKMTVDSYSLLGFSQAIDRALKDCPGT